MSCFSTIALGGLLLSLYLPNLAFASSALARNLPKDNVSGETVQCIRHISYTAPASCPDAEALQRQLGSAYRLHATEEHCPDCSIDITVRGKTQDGIEMHYELEFSGLESTPARRPVCEEVVALALHTVEASNLPAACAGRKRQRSPLLPVELGTFFAPSVHLSSDGAHAALGLQATWAVGDLRASANALWIPQTQAATQFDSTTFGTLSLAGYGAGLDACWSTLSWLHLCGVGLWRQFSISPVGRDWANVEPASVLTGGGAVSVTWQADSGVGIELQPALLFSPNQSTTRDRDTGEVLHDYAGFEARLRMTVAWSLNPNTSFTEASENVTHVR